MIKYIFAIALMFLACTSSVAEEEGNIGKIDSVNPEYLDMVIDDSVFTFALNMKVFDVKGRAVNRYALKPGAHVKYEFIREPSGQRQLSHVWLVSESSK